MLSTDRSVSRRRPSVRARILDAARRNFSSLGYAATSLRHIASEASVTKPMVYYYFGSKAGLYQALLDAVHADFKAALDQLAAEHGSPRERLVRLTQMHLDFLRGNADTVRLLLVPAPEPGGSTCAARFASLHTSAIAQILAQAREAGEIGEVDATLFAAVCRGAIAAVHHEKLTGNDLAVRIVDMLWEGAMQQHRPEATTR